MKYFRLTWNAYYLTFDLNWMQVLWSNHKICAHIHRILFIYIYLKMLTYIYHCKAINSKYSVQKIIFRITFATDDDWTCKINRFTQLLLLSNCTELFDNRPNWWLFTFWDWVSSVRLPACAFVISFFLFFIWWFPLPINQVFNVLCTPFLIYTAVVIYWQNIQFVFVFDAHTHT